MDQETGSETPESVRRSSAQSREKYRVKDGEMTDFQQFMLKNLLIKFNQMDTNNDGFISCLEFKQFYEKEGSAFDASLAAFEFVMAHATDGRVSQDGFLQAYGFTKPE